MSCELVHTYLDNADYGYDQIKVGSSEFNRILDTLDTNIINNIDTVREREIRMFNKLNAYQPIQTPSKAKLAHFNSANHNLFNFGDEHYVQCDMNHPSMLYMKQTPPKKANERKEGFNEKYKRVQLEEYNNIEQLQDEIENMEQKNNMLLLFIFFLVVIILVQYAKHNNDPLKILLVPVDKTQKQTPETIKDAMIDAVEIDE